MNRTIIAKTPLAADQLLFKSMNGTEELSHLFDFNVFLVSPDPSIDSEQLIGKSITLEITADKGVKRYLNGVVTEFCSLGMDGDEVDYYFYQARLQPEFWYLTQNQDSRVFVEKTVLEMADTVLAGLDFRVDCTGDYRKWGQCTQFQESSHQFLARIMEQEGIYYYFEHKDGAHTLVLTDNLSTHKPTTPALVSYALDNSTDEHNIDIWLKKNQITTNKFTVQEYNYTNAKLPMVSSEQLKKKGDIDVEKYEFFAGFKDVSEAAVYSKIRSEEASCRSQIIEAGGNILTITPGFVVTLARLPSSADNGDYLITKAEYNLTEAGYTTGDVKGNFRIAFLAISKDTQYRPLRVTKKPQVIGIQSAIVTGPAGKEVHTNDYGDVKIKFQWDRTGPENENSSNWVRVSQGSAGGGFGSINTPRIGEEVIVDFINGDIDRPLIITRAYNSAILPPWGFPDAAKQSGIRSKSFDSPQANFNELMFNDSAGSELVNFQAQKDLTSLVKNNETRTVNVDRETTIGNDETVTVVGNRKETVEKDETINIVQNRTETVGQNEVITINQNRNRTVVQNEGVSIGQNQNLTVGQSQATAIAIDQKTEIGSNQDLSIGGSRNKHIGGNEVSVINIGRMQTVGVGSVDNVGAAQMTNIGGGYSLNVGGGMLAAVGITEAHKVGKTFNVNAGKTIELTGGKKVSISAGDKLSIQCGSSIIVLNKNGTIEIIGKKLKIGGSSAVKIEGGKVDIN